MISVSEIAQNFNLKRKGREYRGTCPICQANKMELAIWDDAGNLRCKCFYGACDSLKLFRLLVGFDSVPIGRVRNQGRQAKIPTGKLMDLWVKSLPPQESPVSEYLRFRGYQGQIPESIRFLPCHKHTSSGQTFPVMLARVDNQNGALQALHRTYLQPNGKGKAKAEPAKMTLGPVGGGSIRLAKATDQVILCEGIETGLALLQETGLPVWACVSAGGLKTILLPDSIQSVIIAADHDTTGLKAAEDAAKRFYYENRIVRVIRPQQPGHDFADQIFIREKQS
jgi:hypothetical protein